MQPPKGTARHRAHMPEGTSGILNARSLATAHRRLAELLQPGLTVLDIGGRSQPRTPDGGRRYHQRRPADSGRDRLPELDRRQC
jgi:hypothetical protein